MMPIQNRGRCRLMLRMPAWRSPLEQATGSDFLDVCEAYEVAWEAIEDFSKTGAVDRVEEFREIADHLESEALYLALMLH